MFERLILVVVFSHACISWSSPASAEETFDEHNLRLGAVEVLQKSPALFSASERLALRAAIRAGTSSDIEQILASKAQIEVVINPEGRVAVRRAAVPPPQVACGLAATWLVHISNTGFVTAPLKVSIAAELGKAAVDVSLPHGKLSGAQSEYQLMRVVINGPTPVDATLLFEVKPAATDPGAQAEIPILLTCTVDPPH